MKKIVNGGDYVMDVRANISYYALLLAKLVGQNERVFAFEPDPENFEILKRNVKVNGHKTLYLSRKQFQIKTKKLNCFSLKLIKEIKEFTQHPKTEKWKK